MKRHQQQARGYQNVLIPKNKIDHSEIFRRTLILSSPEEVHVENGTCGKTAEYIEEDGD